MDRFLSEYAEAKLKPGSAQLYRYLLKNLIAPKLGTRKAKDITRSEVERLHNSEKERRPVVANRAIATLCACYGWAADRGIVPRGTNPVAGIRKFREQPRERYLTLEEMQRLGAAIREAETVGIPWDIDETKPTIKHLPKTSKRRTVISPVVATAIRLLLFGLNGDVAVGPLAPPVSVDVGFIDILDHLKMTFMGTFEARYDRFGWIADISYLAVGVSASGPLGFVNGELTSKTFFGTFSGAYRVSEQTSGWLDIVGGARVWWLGNELDITAPGPTSRSFAKEKSWVDPIIGFRARANLSPQWFAQVYADVGGFGVGANLDWQVVGVLGYQYSATTSFFAGYRYLAVDYNKGGVLFDVNMHGPIFGASFRF